MTDYYEKTAGYERIFWEMWSAFWVFRTLGFKPDDIFAAHSFDGDPGPHFGKRAGFMVLKAQGLKFTMKCGDADALDEITFMERWKAFGAELNAAKFPRAVRERMWDQPLANAEKVAIVVALTNKGFKFPRSQS